MVMSVHAQQTKSISVEEGMPYEEALTFPFDEKGVELKVMITFDEHTNELLLKVSGSRPLFVFQEDVYRNRVFTGFFSRKHLRPERLSYPVLVAPRANFYLTKRVIKRFAKPRGKHLFNRWVDGVSTSLTPLPPVGDGQSGNGFPQRFNDLLYNQVLYTLFGKSVSLVEYVKIILGYFDIGSLVSAKAFTDSLIIILHWFGS